MVKSASSSVIAHLFTDGAIYQPDGTLTMIGPKVRAVRHLSSAVAMRGPYLAFAPIMEEISAATSSREIRWWWNEGSA